jgi:iron(III) transport system substrate-binding protein
MERIETRVDRQGDAALRLSRSSRINRRAFLGTLALGSAAAFGACQPRPETAQTPAVAPANSAGAAAGATGAESERQWNELIDAARREGRVVVATQPRPKLRTDLPAAFQRRFGIELEYQGIPTGELMSRLDAERAAGQYNLDVVLAGATSLYTQAMPNRLLDPLRPALVSPEVTDGAKWVSGRVWFMDPEQEYILRLSNLKSLVVAVNTDYFPASTFTSWRDLLDPRYRGKISVHDPGIAGSGWNTANYLLRMLGEDYVRTLYVDQQPGLSRDERQLSDWIARGAYPISLGLTATQIEPLREDAFPIGVVLRDTPEAPGVISGGTGLGGLVNRAPHPNAAKLFLNWIAMPEGQQVWNQALEFLSVRTDVDNAWAADYVKPSPGVNYFDTYDWDYVMSTRSPEELEKLRRLVGR